MRGIDLETSGVFRSLVEHGGVRLPGRFWRLIRCFQISGEHGMKGSCVVRQQHLSAQSHSPRTAMAREVELHDALTLWTASCGVGLDAEFSACIWGLEPAKKGAMSRFLRTGKSTRE